jgi:hypothetical protein
MYAACYYYSLIHPQWILALKNLAAFFYLLSVLFLYSYCHMLKILFGSSPFSMCYWK